MTPIEALWNILKSTIQVGVDINNAPIYIDSNRVQIENQYNFINTDPGLFVVLMQTSPSQQAGIQKKIIDIPLGGLQEQIIVLYRSMIAIELFSKDFSAVQQKDLMEVYLNSYISTNLQAQYNIFIAEMSQTPISLSQIEGSDRINRFRFDVSVNSSVAITNDIPYYDTNFIPQVIFNN